MMCSDSPGDGNFRQRIVVFKDGRVVSRVAGTTREERDLYEWNARNIITLWGTTCTEGQEDDLNLYAHKQWQGMFTSYYLPRWQEFFSGLNRAVDTRTSFDRAPFAAAMCRWEQEWSHRHETFPTRPRGDALAVSQRLYSKYRRQLEELR